MIEVRASGLRYVTSGCVKSADRDLAERLKTILDGLREVIAANAPSAVAVEKVFVNVNPQSTLLLGQARGAAICAAVACGLPVSEYTALQVKQAVVGNGHAAKEQVQAMVRRLLQLPGDPSADSADALAYRERLREIGGTFQLDSTPGSGTRISLVYPLNLGKADASAYRPIQSAAGR